MTEAARDKAALIRAALIRAALIRAAPISICSRRAGKTRATFRCILEEHTDWTPEEIDAIMEEIFDSGPEI